MVIAAKGLKRIQLLLAVIMSMAIAGSCNAATESSTNGKSYRGTTDIFPNPERGFSIDALSNNQDSPLYLGSLQQARNNNMTLVRRVYVISSFRYGDLSQSFLDFVKKDCETARQAGVKLVVRFAYDWHSTGYDASRDRVLSHLDQLKPVLEENQDVIAYMEAGFIGAWGEWHSSSSGLNNTQDEKAILSKLLSVLPQERMVALRYSSDKVNAFSNGNPLTPQEAFNGTERARTGAHNDCFVSSPNDSGTYNANDPDSTKSFLSLDNRYVPQGGETCRVSTYDDCPNVLQELQRMRWSQLNSDFEAEVLKGWETQGCMATIKKRLGYRFRLVKSSISKSVKPGGTFLMRLEIFNDGWASPYNRRGLEVILRHSQTGKEYYLPINQDPRMWMPNVAKIVNIQSGIPTNMPSGKYQVFLNLPDPNTNLRNRPEYSIRLANQDVWEASTGYNSLLQSVNIDSGVGGSNYSGNQIFTSR